MIHLDSERFSAEFSHKKRTSKTEWKSFEFYSESSSDYHSPINNFKRLQ